MNVPGQGGQIRRFGLGGNTVSCLAPKASPRVQRVKTVLMQGDEQDLVVLLKHVLRTIPAALFSQSKNVSDTLKQKHGAQSA